MATLVKQDCLDLKIPIKFPRQRIYEGRVPEAYEQWNDLINFDYTRAYFLAVGESLQSLGTALGAGSIPSIFCCSLPIPSWQELSLREVYFHPPIGTQYEIEVSWIRPIPYEDSCGTSFTGYSQMEDGDKDSGLPSDGIQPNVAEDQDDPYEGLPPETTNAAQGAFANNKVPSFDEVDPNNEPFQPLQWDVTFTDACGVSTTTRATYGYGITPAKIVVHPSYPYGSDVNTCAGGNTVITPGPSYSITLNGSTDALNVPYGGGWRNITFAQVL